MVKDGYILEDIDDDASSIYLTSNQKLDKFIPASIYQKSFGANLKQSENINTFTNRSTFKYYK